ncbi:hypothetical protein RCK87_25320, partial [Salmonella enterica subsp. enterica serovar 1,4,[5],12:i:-]
TPRPPEPGTATREPAPAQDGGEAAAVAFEQVRELKQPVYSRSYRDADGQPAFQVLVPLIDRGNFAGALMAEYSVEGLMRYFIPNEVANRHA